jgi:hypothetical protein
MRTSQGPTDEEVSSHVGFAVGEMTPGKFSIGYFSCSHKYSVNIYKEGILVAGRGDPQVFPVRYEDHLHI